MALGTITQAPLQSRPVGTLQGPRINPCLNSTTVIKTECSSGSKVPGERKDRLTLPLPRARPGSKTRFGNRQAASQPRLYLEGSPSQENITAQYHGEAARGHCGAGTVPSNLGSQLWVISHKGPDMVPALRGEPRSYPPTLETAAALELRMNSFTCPGR